jgi:hypothetical protein
MADIDEGGDHQHSTPVTCDDRGEEGDNDAEEDGAVRVSGSEIPEGESGGSSRHGNGRPTTQQQQGRAEQKQAIAEYVQVHPAVLVAPGGRGAEHLGDGDGERGAREAIARSRAVTSGSPGQPAARTRPMVPRCRRRRLVRHAATLNRLPGIGVHSRWWSFLLLREYTVRPDTDLVCQPGGREVEEFVPGVDDAVELAEEFEADETEELGPGGDQGGDGRWREFTVQVPDEPPGVGVDRFRQRRRSGDSQRTRSVGGLGYGYQGKADAGGGADSVEGGAVPGHGRAVDQGVFVGMAESPIPHGAADRRPPLDRDLLLRVGEGIFSRLAHRVVGVDDEGGEEIVTAWEIAVQG